MKIKKGIIKREFLQQCQKWGVEQAVKKHLKRHEVSDTPLHMSVALYNLSHYWNSCVQLVFCSKYDLT